MSLLFFDGFETYGLGIDAFTEMQDVYDYDDDNDLTGATITIASSSRIAGGQSLQIYNSTAAGDLSTTRSVIVYIRTAQTTIIVGFAVRVPDGLNGSAEYTYLMGFGDVYGSNMIALRLRGNGDLRLEFINTPSATVVVDTAVGAITDTDWHYVEAKITFHNSAGAYDIRVDEITVMSDSGVDTTNSGNTVPYLFSMSHVQNKRLWIDDLYVQDDAGAAPYNDFLGDVYAQRVRPNAAGDSSQFTAYPGAGDNFEDVVEDTEDGDSSYVESNTATDKDLYNYDNVDPFNVGTIFAVIAKPVVTKPVAGSRTYRLIAKSGGTEDYSDTIYPSAGSYVRHTHIWTTDPDTGTAWTATSFNAAQFGLEIVS